MMDRVTIRQVIDALECQNTVGNTCKGEQCPYYYQISEEEIDSFCAATGADRNSLSEGFAHGCECERTAHDAAEHLMTMPQWVEVSERMPETYPTGVGTGYSETVAVLMENYDVDTAIWTGRSWIMTHPTAKHPAVTHWMPVTPLPKDRRDE